MQFLGHIAYLYVRHALDGTCMQCACHAASQQPHPTLPKAIHALRRQRAAVPKSARRDEPTLLDVVVDGGFGNEGWANGVDEENPQVSACSDDLA